MPDPDIATSDALAAAPTDGLVTRDAVTFFARDRSSGEIVAFPFWVGDDTVTADVVDGETGATVSRDFVGQGGAVDGTPLISIADIPWVNDLSVQTVTVVMSQLHATVQTMFRGYDLRLARAEIHRLLLDPQTHNLVGVPVCHFIGQVNLAPLGTPAVGDEGNLSIDIVSDTQELTRTNPAKMSDATMQARHSGDTMFQYVSQFAAGLDLPWGEDKVST